jgi:hypothetical protein
MNILTDVTGSAIEGFYTWLEKDRYETELEMAKKKKKRGRKPKNKMYFTIATENAIVAYNNTNTQYSADRNKLYNDYIKYAFYKLAENMIHTFKFYYFQDSVEEVKHEVIAHLIEKMPKFQKGKGKAFSYFSIVAKNYLIFHNNNNYKNMKKMASINDWERGSASTDEFYKSDIREKTFDFMNAFVDYCYKNLDKIFSNDRDKRVADAILIIFAKRDNIENFNKKALYLMIREMTDVKTQYITRVVNILKAIYIELNNKFERTGHIN